MKKLIIGSFLLLLSFSTFASSPETAAFVERVRNRDCTVLLDILLERTVEANRLGLAAYSGTEKNERMTNRLLELSNAQFELSDAVKVLLVDKCFIQK